MPQTNARCPDRSTLRERHISMNFNEFDSGIYAVCYKYKINFVRLTGEQIVFNVHNLKVFAFLLCVCVCSCAFAVSRQQQQPKQTATTVHCA